MIRARRPRILRLLLRAGRTDHRRADRLQPASHQLPDTARRRPHQHRLPRLHARAAVDQRLDRTPLQQHCGGSAIVDIVGQPEKLLRRDVACRGIGAARRPERADPIAHRQAIDALTHRLDHTRRLAAEPRRQIDRIDAAAMIGVDIVQADRMVAHPHFARPGRRQVDVDPFDHLRPAGAGDACDAFAHMPSVLLVPRPNPRYAFRVATDPGASHYRCKSDGERCDD